MPYLPEPMDWSFLTLVDWWNLYGLPVLLLVVLLASGARNYLRWWAGPGIEGREQEELNLTRAGGSSAPSAHEVWLHLDRARVVRLIALIHLGLGLRAGIALSQELLTLRAMGIPQSFPITGILAPAVSVMANLTIGHGLWRLRRWARHAAIGWDALVAVLSSMIEVWSWNHDVPVEPSDWPLALVSILLPWFLLAVMLMRGTRSVFTSGRVLLNAARTDSGRLLQSRSSSLRMLSRLFLIVVTSTLVVDLADWLLRLINGGAD